MVIIALMTPMSQFPGNSLLYRDGNTDGNQNHEGDNCDAVVAKEGKDEGEGEKPKENMGEEVNWSLKPIKQAWLPIHWPISIRTCSNPPFAATLNRIRIYVCFPFESFLIWKKNNLGDGDNACSYSDKLEISIDIFLSWTEDELDKESWVQM